MPNQVETRKENTWQKNCRKKLSLFLSQTVSAQKGVLRNFRTIARFLNTSHFLTVAIFCCVTAGVFFNASMVVNRVSTIDEGMAIAAIPPVSEDNSVSSEVLNNPDVDPEIAYNETEGSILQGDTLINSFKRHGVTDRIGRQIIYNIKELFNCKEVQPGDIYSVATDEQGELVRYTYESGPLDVYVLNRVAHGTYKAEKQAVPLERHTLKIEGTIDSSLFAAFSSFNEDAKLVYNFADIFSSKIDFNTETRAGDRFCLVYDKFFKDGDSVGYGKIRAAKYESQELGLLEGYYFSSANIRGAYFDAEGKELGATFIKSPVPIARISSTFSYNRRHPVLQTVRPHLGVDLAAPSGTPVMAAADGTVHFIGRKGGYGKQVILDHGNGYMTYYGHLSSFSKQLRKGSRVTQKQIVGYVGATGIATGPHLDYRINVNGTFQNPFSLKFKTRSTLSGVALEKFLIHRNHLTHLEKILDDPQIVHVKNVLITPKNSNSFL